MRIKEIRTAKGISQRKAALFCFLFQKKNRAKQRKKRKMNVVKTVVKKNRPVMGRAKLQLNCNIIAILLQVHCNLRMIAS